MISKKSVKKYNNYKDFDWKVYLEINTDLPREFNENECKNHFLNHGIHEKRNYRFDDIIPSDFDWKVYLEINTDLPRDFSENNCKGHFLNHGKYENRKYKFDDISIPSDFDWKVYLDINSDLPQHFSENDCKVHYLTLGVFENRIYKPAISVSLPIDETLLIDDNLPLDYGLQLNTYYNHSVISSNDKDLVCNKQEVKCIDSDDVIKIYDDVLNCYDYLEAQFLLNTRPFYKENTDFLKYKIENSNLDNLNSFILIIDFQNGGGGTTHFLNTIISKYKIYQTFVVARNYNNLLHLNINEEFELTYKYNFIESLDFLNNYKHKISKIFINHIKDHHKEFLNKLFTLNVEVITITHDYSILTDYYQPYFHEIEQKILNNPPVIDAIKYNMIITQNKVNLNTFKNFNTFKNLNTVVELPDFRKSNKLFINKKNIITVAIIGNLIDIKGKQMLVKIIDYYKKDINVEIVVIGHVEIPNFKNFFYYNSIYEFNEILLKVQPNILLELSLWPETYSYTLTLGMLTNLPILYFNKSFDSVIENRLNKYNKAYPLNSLNHLNRLIKKYQQNYFFTIYPMIYYNKFWNDLFITKKNIPLYVAPRDKSNSLPDTYKFDIKPYFIYFPQFHNFKENDINFYNDYNDIINLQYYNLINDNKIDEPLHDYFQINNLNQYNYIKNSSIIQKQVNLLDLYNFEGFAIYYYWFSINNITNKNMIMDNVIDKFFDNSVDLKNKKLFFIWANENWSDNEAFVNSNKTNNKHDKKIIINNYNTPDFTKNSQNLIKYFKHPNYLKIDNKPVFFIYHSFLFTDNEINNFYNILNRICCMNKFSGVHLVLNSFTKTYNNFTNFYINFNYKSEYSRDSTFFDEQKQQIYLDYNTYSNNTSNIKQNTIQTVCFDFNNKPRLFEPDKLRSSTICIKNTEYDKITFTKKLINTYNRKKTELEKILLVNSLNEWGENMAFEPCNKYEYYNLNLLKDCLKSD